LFFRWTTQPLVSPCALFRGVNVLGTGSDVGTGTDMETDTDTDIEVGEARADVGTGGGGVDALGPIEVEG
jgi:hypothetical protein